MMFRVGKLQWKTQMKMQLSDMKRRAEQGSMQVQGEAKELVIVHKATLEPDDWPS